MKRGGGKKRRSGSSERVRFAVIGQGYFAQAAVLPGVQAADGCELRAIFSEDETKLRALRRKYGVAAALGYDQYDDYLRSGEVDAVYIALPNDMHAEYADPRGAGRRSRAVREADGARTARSRADDRAPARTTASS